MNTTKKAERLLAKAVKTHAQLAVQKEKLNDILYEVQELLDNATEAEDELAVGIATFKDSIERAFDRLAEQL
jgi:hypothetical protein